MRYRILSALLGLALCGSGVVLAAGSYTQTFDGAPGAPQPAAPGLTWDVLVHSDFQGGTWTTMAGLPMEASHGATCGGPPATHHVASYDDAVFHCANHIMTAINGDSGYAAIYLTPPQMLDFSGGEQVVRWDMSTLRASARDWVDLWVTPWADRLPMPLDDWIPDLQGEPRTAVHMKLDNGASGTFARVQIVRNFAMADVPGQSYVQYETVLAPDAARRDTFEVRISRTHLKVWMPAYNLVWFDGAIADLGWDSGIVQFGHHSYNPSKACDFNGTCGPGTWHWDNVTLSNAIPFSIGKVSPRTVSNEGAPPLVFDAPAPPGATLQFEAFGSNVQVSWDNGVTWVNAPAAPEERHENSHFDAYMVPVPEGQTGARVRSPGSPYGFQWMARNFSVWSQQVGVPRTPTPTPPPPPPTATVAPNTPTAVPPTATRTATPEPPTVTVTPLPTATLGPTSTPMPSPTLLPTSTPAPDPTATPAPNSICALVSLLNGAWTITPQAAVNCPQ